MSSTETRLTLYERLSRQTHAARAAARVLANKSTSAKNKALDQMAALLLLRQEEILRANAHDVEQAASRGAKKSFIDRLTLTPARIQSMATGIQAIMALPDPIGEIQDRWQLSNGMIVEKRSVPLGVIAMIYEARPNVTVDAAALALKTGNAVVLRGSADALASNIAITAALREGLRLSEFPEDAVQLVDAVEHEAVDILVRMKESVDLIIPRGGASLISSVV
ncbi:MAG: aldehyde dehydrogenase family protein, partial [Chloroflexi bacterium]|nr:aldehyde dehydrogenase family protein [Chloroflexota bacterium]